MKAKEVISNLTLEEKILLLTGGSGMGTHAIERLDVPAREMADGPHGIRFDNRTVDCTLFPSLCCLGASWDVSVGEQMGEGIARDCLEHNIDMILGPGINIKKNILCGRNFEYLSEDPVLAGEMAAGYVNGLQGMGVGACVKHFACNNQEQYRQTTSVEIDERTLREIYLKPFEIVVKKSAPAAIMSGYNKVNSIWCSENPFLLTEVLKQEWNYQGFCVSDWGGVHDICRAVMAGTDLEMPQNPFVVEQIKAGLQNGTITMEAIDTAVYNVLQYVMQKNVEKPEYDRTKQHQIAVEVATEGIVLLKNDAKTLPLTDEKYKTIAVVGEYAVSPLISGQGSAEVYPEDRWIDSPLEELKKRLPNTEIRYMGLYETHAYSKTMLWPKCGEFAKFIEDADLVLFFTGAMESEDTENFDRRTAQINPNHEFFINMAVSRNCKTAVVLQNGSAMILGDWADKAEAIVEMWLGGEGAGSAIANALCGYSNPSGKLSETFPKVMRRDFEYPGTPLKVSYDEKLDVGYRYYDKHPEEIRYPFGHGLSYTDFAYTDGTVSIQGEMLSVSMEIRNTGDCDGAEVVQLYVGDPVATMSRPIKELKAFKKIFLKEGQAEKISFTLPVAELAYYNTMLHEWVVENGEYSVFLGSSSRDIRITLSFIYEGQMSYSMHPLHETMLGERKN